MKNILNARKFCGFVIDLRIEGAVLQAKSIIEMGF